MVTINNEIVTTTIIVILIQSFALAANIPELTATRNNKTIRMSEILYNDGLVKLSNNLALLKHSHLSSSCIGKEFSEYFSPNFAKNGILSAKYPAPIPIKR